MRSCGEGEIGGEISAIVRRAARSTRGAIDERARRTIVPISPPLDVASPRDLVFSSAARSQFDQI